MVTKSPEEIKMMTSKQFDCGKEVVFSASLSLLQSEGFMIESADKETGLMKAYKRIENTKAEQQLLWTGRSKNASMAKIMVYVEALNGELTDTKITIYEGTEMTIAGGFNTRSTKVIESMVYDADIYAKWFNALRAEIERRKALQ